MARGWVERTPDAFVFDVKAHALMTGHATEVARLPPAFRAALPPELAKASRLYAKDLPAELEDEVWRTFRDALEPLRDSGKLGAVLLQFAPWVTPTKKSPAMFERARDRLGDLPIAVEFRNAAWLSERLRSRTWDLLGRLRHFVCRRRRAAGNSDQRAAAGACHASIAGGDPAARPARRYVGRSRCAGGGEVPLPLFGRPSSTPGSRASSKPPRRRSGFTWSSTTATRTMGR